MEASRSTLSARYVGINTSFMLLRKRSCKQSVQRYTLQMSFSRRSKQRSIYPPTRLPSPQPPLARNFNLSSPLQITQTYLKVAYFSQVSLNARNLFFKTIMSSVISAWKVSSTSSTSTKTSTRSLNDQTRLITSQPLQDHPLKQKKSTLSHSLINLENLNAKFPCNPNKSTSPVHFNSSDKKTESFN